MGIMVIINGGAAQGKRTHEEILEGLRDNYGIGPYRLRHG